MAKNRLSFDEEYLLASLSQEMQRKTHRDQAYYKFFNSA